MHKALVNAHSRVRQHYHRHYREKFNSRAHLVFIFDAILIGLALLLLGSLFYLRYFYKPLRDDLRVTIETPSGFGAAERGEITVRAENLGKARLEDVRLHVYLPAAFRSEDLSAPAFSYGEEILIGKLEPGASLDRIFPGVLVTPQPARAYASLTARREGEVSTDEKLGAGTIAPAGSKLSAEWSLPASGVAGQRLPVTVTVKNDSAFTFKKAALSFEWPEGFRVLASTPPVYRGAAALGDLAPGEEARFAATGVFSRDGDFAPIARLSADVAGATFPLIEARGAVEIIASKLSIETFFPSGAPASLLTGEEARARVRVRNDGEFTARDLRVSLPVDARLAEVRWEDAPSAGVLSPGETREFSATVRIRPSISRYVTNPTLSLAPDAVFSIPDHRVEGATVTGTGPSLRIGGGGGLSTVARYFTAEGDQIGRGPLPPRVGETTRYWIFASVSGGVSEMRDAQVTITLPAGVAWTGRMAVSSGNEPTLTGSKLTWAPGTIPAHAGQNSPVPSLSFEVSLEPTAAQAGTAPPIVLNAALTAVDAWTERPLADGSGILTTALPGDTYVRGRTQVRP